VCGECPYVIEVNPELRAKGHAGVLKDINEVEGEYEAFMQKVKAWEDEKNSKSGGRVKAVRTSAGAETRVQASSSSSLSLTKHMGYLWPCTLYRKHKQKKPSPKDIVTIEFDGKPVKGIVLDESHGTPHGVIKIEAKSDTTVSKTAILADNRAAVDDDDVNKVWASAQKKQRVASTPHVSKSTGESCIRIKPSELDLSDSDGDDAALHSVWGTRLQRGSKRVCSSASSGGESETSMASTRKSKGSSVKKLRRTAKSEKSASKEKAKQEKAVAPKEGGPEEIAKPKAMTAPVPPYPSPSPNKPSKSARQIAKELDIAEQTLLQCDQMLQSLADDARALTVSAKSFNVLLTKVSTRLSPELVSMYSKDYVAGSESRGMAILEKLRKSKESLEVAKHVVEALGASEGELATAGALMAAVAAARASGATVSQRLNEVVLARAVAESVSTRDFDSVAKVLHRPTGSEPDPKYDDVITLSIVPVTIAKDRLDT
jgi:hypothetical protein